MYELVDSLESSPESAGSGHLEVGVTAIADTWSSQARGLGARPRGSRQVHEVRLGSFKEEKRGQYQRLYELV